MLKILSAIIVFFLILFSCSRRSIKPEVEDAVIPVDKSSTAYVIRDNINMRENGSHAAKKIGVLMDGEEVKILQNKSGWYNIEKNDRTKGWVRSDFVGPKSLSYNLKSADFVENTLKSYDVEMLIDQNNPYAVVYMVLPDKYYKSKSSAENIVREIGISYQKEVYPGQVEIRILRKDKKNLFSKVILSKKGAVNFKAPLLKYGRSYSFKITDNNKIKIQILIPGNLSEETLLQMCEEISMNYGVDIRKIELYFIEDSAEGIKFLTGNGYKPVNKNVCRFYYMEDSNGPDWESNFCK